MNTHFDEEADGHAAAGGHDLGTVLYEVDEMAHGLLGEVLEALADELRQVGDGDARLAHYLRSQVLDLIGEGERELLEAGEVLLVVLVVARDDERTNALHLTTQNRTEQTNKSVNC